MHSQRSSSLPRTNHTINTPSIDSDGIRVSSHPPKTSYNLEAGAVTNEPYYSIGPSEHTIKDGIRVYSSEYVDRLDQHVVVDAAATTTMTTTRHSSHIQDDGIRVRGGTTATAPPVTAAAAAAAATSSASSSLVTRQCLEIDPVTGLQAGHPALQPPVRRPRPHTKRNSNSSKSKPTVPQPTQPTKKGMESVPVSVSSESSTSASVTAPAQTFHSNVPLMERTPVDSNTEAKPKRKKGLLSKLHNIIRSRSHEKIPTTNKVSKQRQQKRLDGLNQCHPTEISSLELSRDFSSHELSASAATAVEATTSMTTTPTSPGTHQATTLPLVVPSSPPLDAAAAAASTAESTPKSPPAMALDTASGSPLDLPLKKEPCVSQTTEQTPPSSLTTEVAATRNSSSIVASSMSRPLLGSNTSVRSFGLDRSNHSYKSRQQSPRSMSSDHSRLSRLRMASGETVDPATTASAATPCPPPPSRLDSFNSNSNMTGGGDGSTMRRTVPRRTMSRSDSLSTIGLDQSDRSRSRLMQPQLGTTNGTGGHTENVPTSVFIERPTCEPNIQTPNALQNSGLRSSSDHGQRPSQYRLNSMFVEGPQVLAPMHVQNSTLARPLAHMPHPFMTRAPLNSSGFMVPHSTPISTRHSFHSDPRGVHPQHATAPMGRSLSAAYPGQSHGQPLQMHPSQSQTNFVWATQPGQGNGCLNCACCLGQMSHGPVNQGYRMGAPVRSFQPRPLQASHGLPNQRRPSTRSTALHPRPIHSLAPRPNSMGCAIPVNTQEGGPIPMQTRPLLNDPRVLATHGQSHPSNLRRSSSLNSPKGGPKSMLPGQLRSAPVRDPRAFVAHDHPHRVHEERSGSIKSPKGGPKPMVPGSLHSAPFVNQPHPIMLRRSSSLNSPKTEPKKPAPSNNAPVNDPRAFSTDGQPRRSQLGISSSMISNKGGGKPMLSGPLNSAPVHHDPRAIVGPVNLRCSSSLNGGRYPIHTDSFHNASVNTPRFLVANGQSVNHGQHREFSQPHHHTASIQQRPAHYNVPMENPVRGLTRSMSFVAPSYTPQQRQIFHADLDGQSVASFRSSRPRALVRSSSVILSPSQQDLGYSFTNEATLVPRHSTGFRPSSETQNSLNYRVSATAPLDMGNRTPIPLRQDQPMLRRTQQPMPCANSFGTMNQMERTRNTSGRGVPVAANDTNGTFLHARAQHGQF